METINTVKQKLNMQYICETLIEDYNDSETESEKYETKIRLVEAIEQGYLNLEKVKAYMRLQEEKFEPFISLLRYVQQPPSKPQTIQAATTNRIPVGSIQLVMVNPNDFTR
jgi:hypothetical protein